MVASPVTIPIQTMNLSPGSHLLIKEVSWEQYESLLQELGEERCIPRINYSKGILEFMSPLPAHERPHRIIGYIVTAILDAQGRDWEDFGSTTFKKLKQAGVEPDTCFYINNAKRVKSLQRIDLEIDPPPDLAIEADITSKTTLEVYEAIRAPEVWIFINNQLKILVLQQSGYVESRISPTFPDLDVVEMIPRLVQDAFTQGTSKMLRALREQLYR
ncbi:MAG: Uma2 family endonuclease [Symploca sp. SIO2E6]|nr:Uma2 family endonuclease [Symploca sp. SIO2E6]